MVEERARLVTYVDRCYTDALTLLEAHERGCERLESIDSELSTPPAPDAAPNREQG